jgi:AcrR family transcriptional regulator
MTSEKSPPSAASFSALPRKYAGVSAQERKQQRRDRLLDAAYDMFGREGYKQTTLRLVCAHARMTDRYFYEHFESMDDLFLQVRQRLSTELVTIIMKVVIQPEPDPILLMRRALTAFFEYLQEDPRRARILMLDAMTFGLTSTEVAKSRLDWYSGMIEARLKARYPHLPPHLNCALVASGFLGQVTYIGSVWTVQKFDTPVEQLVDHLIYTWVGLHQWLADYNATVPVHSAG